MGLLGGGQQVLIQLTTTFHFCPPARKMSHISERGNYEERRRSYPPRAFRLHGVALYAVGGESAVEGG